MPLSDHDDNALYALYRDDRDGAGREAFNVLVGRYQEDLTRRISLRVRDAQAAEDIVQNVFIQLMEAAHKFDETKSSFTGWMNWLAVNRGKNERRDRYRRPLLSADWGKQGQSDVIFEEAVYEHGGDDWVSKSDRESGYTFNEFCTSDELDPETKACQAELVQAFWKFVTQLDESHRQTLILVFVKHLHHDEAARILGLSRKTIGRRLRALLPELRAAMGDSVEDLDFALERRSVDRALNAAICA